MTRHRRHQWQWLALFAMAGCGSPPRPQPDVNEIWTGGGNNVRTGGYWFSYADHVAWMAAHPDLNPAHHTASQGASITPLSDMKTPLTIETDPDSSSGHGDTVHITGTTPPAPAWDDVSQNGNWFDTYYQQQQLYPDSLTVAYPVAGVGFGFAYHNAAFDIKLVTRERAKASGCDVSAHPADASKVLGARSSTDSGS